MSWLKQQWDKTARGAVNLLTRRYVDQVDEIDWSDYQEMFNYLEPVFEPIASDPASLSKFDQDAAFFVEQLTCNGVDVHDPYQLRAALAAVVAVRVLAMQSGEFCHNVNVTTGTVLLHVTKMVEATK